MFIQHFSLGLGRVKNVAVKAYLVLVLNFFLYW